MKPDFLITPYEVKVHPKLRPTDGDIYAVVYWLQHMALGRCTAGNDTIADVLSITERAVRAGLERLEQYGYIQRLYLDPERKVRTEIRALLKFAKVPGVAGLPSVEVKEKERSPGEVAKEFFRDDQPGREAKMAMLNSLLDAYPGINREAVILEMKKFVVYWTEPNKSGTKQKWQLQQTFDVKRRLWTWLTRAGTYQKNNTKAGAGVEI